MSFFQTASFHCRPPQNLSLLYAQRSQFPVYQLNCKKAFLVDYGTSSFLTVFPLAHSIKMVVGADEYLVMEAVSVLALGTLRGLMDDLPINILFQAENEVSPSAFKRALLIQPDPLTSECF